MAATMTGEFLVPTGFVDYSYVYYLIMFDIDFCPELVYVGVTNNLAQRVGHHAQDKVFHLVRWEAYETRAEAQEIEAHMIKTYQPRFNRAGLEGRLIPEFHTREFFDVPPNAAPIHHRPLEYLTPEGIETLAQGDLWPPDNYINYRSA